LDIFGALLGGEVKVESSLESVELELTGREESSGSRGCGHLLEGSVESRLERLGRLGLETSLVTGEQTSLRVGSIEWVDEGVDSSTVGTGGHTGSSQGASRAGSVLGGELGSIGIVLEVTVGRVEGVDEGVEVGVNRLINIIIVGRSLHWQRSSSLTDRGSLTDGGSLADRGSLTDGGSLADRGSSLGRLGVGMLRGEGGRVETVGTSWHMGTAQNLESILASRVLDSVGLAIIANIAVLTNSFASGSSLLSKNDTILLGICRPESAITSVEPLLLKDLGILGVNMLTGGSNGQTRGDNKFQHDGSVCR